MKLIKIMLLIFLPMSALAQKDDIREKDVPQAVLKNFILKYPEAKTRTWKTKNGNYEVDFYVNMKKYEAKYEAEGKWKKTSWKIGNKEVPQAVLNSWKASEFSRWMLDDSYRVEADDHKELYMLRVVKAGKEMELLYRPDGDLLKAKSKNDK